MRTLDQRLSIARLVLALQHSSELSDLQINRFLLSSVVQLGELAIYSDPSIVSERVGSPHLPADCVLSKKDWAYADRIVDRLPFLQMDVLPLISDLYPRPLRAIPNPPPLLYVRGELSAVIDSEHVSVVGTRHPSETGKEIAHRISSFFASNDWVVVSGLALGIDACAHRGALDAEGQTVAVLAHGLHRSSPKANGELALDILEAGGAWISEHPPGVEPHKHFFVTRNRIQVGISAGSVIVECSERSGTLTQAQYGIGQGREIFAVLPEKEQRLDLNIEGARALVEVYGAHRLRSRDNYSGMLDLLRAKNRELMQSSGERMDG